MPWKEVLKMNQRVEFALKALRTENFRELCQEYGISAKTGYKWRERFLQHGLAGMEELSRKPLKSPKGLGESVVCEIVRLKGRHKHWGPRKIRELYRRQHGEAPSESTFKRVLERAGMTEKRVVRQRESTGRLYQGRVAKEPNEVWTVDFKGWWYSREGGRCEPLTVRDEFSRYVLDVRAVADSRTETVKACFERLFEKYGLPGAIRSDNGSPFAAVSSVLGLSRLSAWWLVLGIDLERSRPGCPQDNGAHERFHLDMSREVEGRDGAEQQAALDQWRKEFNEERPHEKLGMKFPAEVYRRSVREYQGTPADVEYRAMEKRKVASTGMMKYREQEYFLSTALRGWSVGVEATSGDLYNVWFGRLLLGQIEPATASFRSVHELAQSAEAAQKAA